MKPCFLFWNRTAETITPAPKKNPPQVTAILIPFPNFLVSEVSKVIPPRRGAVLDTNVRRATGAAVRRAVVRASMVNALIMSNSVRYETTEIYKHNATQHTHTHTRSSLHRHTHPPRTAPTHTRPTTNNRPTKARKKEESHEQPRPLAIATPRPPCVHIEVMTTVRITSTEHKDAECVVGVTAGRNQVQACPTTTVGESTNDTLTNRFESFPFP